MVVEAEEKLETQDLINKGVSLQEQGHYEKAIRYFSEVIGMKPGMRWPTIDVALLIVSLGNMNLLLKIIPKQFD